MREMLCLDWFAAGLIFLPFRYFVFICYWRNWWKSCQDLTAARGTKMVPMQCDLCSDSWVHRVEWGEWEKVFEGASPKPRAVSKYSWGFIQVKNGRGGRKHVRFRELEVTWGGQMRAVGWTRARSWHAKELRFYLKRVGKIPNNYIQGDCVIRFTT